MELPEKGASMTWVTPRRVDFAIGALCLLLGLEAVLFAPVNVDAAFTLRQAAAQAQGALPCRDIHCEYTPLVSSVLSLVQGSVVPSLFLAQLAILACGLLAGRLALTLGYPPENARRVFVATWALMIANEGRTIEYEPLAVACLLCAVNAFAASKSHYNSFRAGLWVAAGFWAKQYALFGWAALMAGGFWTGRRRGLLFLTAGTLAGGLAPALALMALGAEPRDLASLFDLGAYPPNPIWSNLIPAPELVGALVLTFLTLRPADFAPSARPDLRLPALLTAAALLPFYFRGYRHYWGLVLPFLLLVLFRTTDAGDTPPVRTARRGAIVLLIFSVGLDVVRCGLDIAKAAREHQRADARLVASLAKGTHNPLYLVRPDLLPWIGAPTLAPKRAGPKFTRFSDEEADAVLADADLVVWDRSVAGSDELLKRLSDDPEGALRDRGFTLLRTVGPVRVYGRAPGT